RTISPCSLRFRANTHLQPITFVPKGRRTISHVWLRM
ncbi:hypothetical protein PHMEG_00041509, partial [Phytophthora megakarya]